MSHNFDHRPPVAAGPLIGALERAMAALNKALLIPCMLALAVAAAILTFSVIVRYFLKIPTDWQDEAAVFVLVGATFLSGAWVQAQRGHIGIEALAGLLPDWLNRLRLLVVDAASAGFCLFFAWKSWTLFHEAWVDKQTTTSSWGPPLSIPYGIMALGMTLVGLQLLIHTLARLAALKDPQ
jgi:TRAP-type C4-dicarboxylate transport system permease small subunit